MASRPASTDPTINAIFQRYVLMSFLKPGVQWPTGFLRPA